ncbi:RELT-like protein 1 [Eucyclogobius newberryi]|uniref:RELT-like protein 1 n=1 Tax=Eucyclogobius newberryi TaxID=166745 RepID=UPI003B5A9E9A
MANSTIASPDDPTVTIKNDAGANSGHDFTAFALVLTFFLLGLTGVVVCHVLKRKGYRCTTEAEEQDKHEEHDCGGPDRDLEMGELNDTMSDNNDTVGQIVHYIMKNEANSDYLKAMIHDSSIDSDGPPMTPTSPSSPTPPLTPVSPGAPPGAPKHTCSHLHTIGGMDGHKNVCTRCSQKKWPLMRKPSARKTDLRRSNCGEVTVLAVGRFRVTKTLCDKPVRRTLLLSETAPSTPTEAEPRSRSASESQQMQTDHTEKDKL